MWTPFYNFESTLIFPAESSTQNNLNALNIKILNRKCVKTMRINNFLIVVVVFNASAAVQPTLQINRRYLMCI